VARSSCSQLGRELNGVGLGEAGAVRLDLVQERVVVGERDGAADMQVAGALGHRAAALDSPPAWWPGDLFGDWRLHDLQEILLHLIVEVACHAGHLDSTRELIDGRQYLVLTD